MPGIPGQGRIKLDIERLKKRYAAGVSLNALARESFVSVPTLSRHLTAAGVTLRSHSEACALARVRTTRPQASTVQSG